MAQSLFDALTVTMDNQTALAVQSLLDSQQGQVAEPAAGPGDDEDVFQCGKCKKQFTSLPTFMSHKREHCQPMPPQQPVRQVVPPPGSNPNQSAFTTSLPHHGLNRQPVSMVSNMTPVPAVAAAYSAVPPSPLAHMSQNMVLNADEILMTTLSSMDQTMTIQTSPNQSMHSGNVQVSGPFMQAQVAPPRPMPTTSMQGMNNVNTAVLTTTIPGQTFQVQPVTVRVAEPQQQQQQQVMMPQQPVPMRASPAKNPQQAPNNNNINIITDVQIQNVTQAAAPKRRAKSGGGNQGAGKKQGKLKCTYCDKMFSKNFDLQQHIRSHTGEKPFQCIVCGRAFAQKSNVKKHMQTHKVWPSGTACTLPKNPIIVEKAVEDQNGESVVDTAEDVGNTHPEQVEKGGGDMGADNSKDSDHSKDGTADPDEIKVIINNSYQCHYCQATFKTYFQLKSHMTEHKNQQVYKCITKSCGSMFHDLEAFLEHTKSHEEEMTYRCHMCNKQFPSLYELGVHQYSHSLYPNQGPRPGPRYFRCPKCMNKYASPEALDHHLATSSHNYSCPHCEKVFPCERYLRRHLPTHGTMGDHVCNVCEKRFKTEHYLKMHVLIHTGEKPYSCSQCNATFNRKDKLKRHMLIHDPVKKYKCPFKTHTGCTKEFNRPDKLKAHIISHSGIKPFKCKDCGKSFSRKPHLQEHERMHSDNYPIRCNTCRKGFAREKYLRDHRCRPEGSEDDVVVSKSKHGRTRKLTAAMKEAVGNRRKRGVGRPRKNHSSKNGDANTDLDIIKAHLQSEGGGDACQSAVRNETEGVEGNVPLQQIQTNQQTANSQPDAGDAHLQETVVPSGIGISTPSGMVQTFVASDNSVVQINMGGAEVLQPTQAFIVTHLNLAPGEDGVLEATNQC
ncbi:PREDICTED: zinc finger protein 341-like [Branchiostoma belcheri]|uniref:Zinc finger protein 341-like n=1 Tax=Branchiostoma belcheri TaxID=7741 RepID=A0A6P4YY13_BRABE|nr:PREDICTED: zinc finger protein 341-like [Branchiostoma belcheri]